MTGTATGGTATRSLGGLLAVCGVFGAAFGVVEGAVVVYLRALLYPEGFGFPLREVPRGLLNMELVREVATILLLLAAAWMVERRPLRRFAVFAYCFAVWDLVYYACLKVALDWPASLLEWDVLFLIPVPWLGPVLAPVLVSLALIAASVTILGERPRGRPFAPRVQDWCIEIAAGLTILATFVANTGAIVRGEAPGRFAWPVFLVALFGGLGYFAWIWRAHQRVSASNSAS